MNCDEFQGRWLAGEPAAEAHMTVCPGCRAAASALDELRADLADPMLWEAPPADLANQVVGRVLAEASQAAGGRRAATRRLLAGAVAVAALVVAVLGAAVALGRPDWTVDLVPTENAPGAEAAVAGWSTEVGTRMRIEVAGLEPSGDDAYYEVWLTAPDGRHVSAGTFRASGTIEVAAGVTRAEFPRIWITLEPADEDESPSRLVVFDLPV